MRKALVIGGLVVIALLAVLWFALKKDLSAAEPTTTSSNPGPSAPVAAPPVNSQPSVTSGTTGDQPSLPQPAAGENPRDYAVGDIRVRDHRAGDHKPLDIPPNVHRAEGRAIPSTLTHEVAQKVKTVMMQCVTDLPKEARGEKPRLEGQISIAIKEKKVTVTKSTMQLRNVSGESVEPTKQCIEQKSIGLENAAPDQADLDDYTINISFAIP
jgi:hypothetical protein